MFSPPTYIAIILTVCFSVSILIRSIKIAAYPYVHHWEIAADSIIAFSQIAVIIGAWIPEIHFYTIGLYGSFLCIPEMIFRSPSEFRLREHWNQLDNYKQRAMIISAQAHEHDLTNAWENVANRQLRLLVIDDMAGK
jgi:hypothetical protein